VLVWQSEPEQKRREEVGQTILGVVGTVRVPAFILRWNSVKEGQEKGERNEQFLGTLSIPGTFQVSLLTRVDFMFLQGGICHQVRLAFVNDFVRINHHDVNTLFNVPLHTDLSNQGG
jgi:hypothetical protein